MIINGQGDMTHQHVIARRRYLRYGESTIIFLNPPTWFAHILYIKNIMYILIYIIQFEYLSTHSIICLWKFIYLYYLHVYVHGPDMFIGFFTKKHISFVPTQPWSMVFSALCQVYSWDVVILYLLARKKTTDVKRKKPT